MLYINKFVINQRSKLSFPSKRCHFMMQLGQF